MRSYPSTARFHPLLSLLLLIALFACSEGAPTEPLPESAELSMESAPIDLSITGLSLAQVGRLISGGPDADGPQMAPSHEPEFSPLETAAFLYTSVVWLWENGHIGAGDGAADGPWLVQPVVRAYHLLSPDDAEIAVDVPAAIEEFNEFIARVRALVAKNALDALHAGEMVEYAEVATDQLLSPPEVVATTPLDGAVDVDPASTITIRFSEHVDVTASGVTLECPAATPIGFTGLPLEDETHVTLSPNDPLPGAVQCLATVLSSEVTDTDGDPDAMEADFLFLFRTRAPVLDPAEFCSDYPASSTATFEDANLTDAVRAALGLEADDALTCERVGGLEALTARNAGIASALGVQNLTGAAHIDLIDNAITDVAPFATLTGLAELFFDGNDVADIDIVSGMSGLRTLSFQRNPIADLTPVTSLTELEQLFFGLIGTTSLDPLTPLTALTQLVADINDISDLTPLAGMTSLTSLDVGGNAVTDVTVLGGLEALELVALDGNPGLADIAALVANPGLGEGDLVNVSHTAVPCTDVWDLRANQVTVIADGLDCAESPPIEVFLSGPNTVQVGDTIRLVAVVQNARLVPSDVTWSSSDPSIATATSTGVDHSSYAAVVGRSAGTATITATSMEDPTKSATHTVTVTDTPFGVVGDVDAVVFYAGGGSCSVSAPSQNTCRYYAFKEDDYVPHALGGPIAGSEALPIDGNWSGWPEGWGPGDLDAAVWYPDNGRYYLFKGDQYARHFPDQPTEAGYPAPIAGNWSGWPAQWGSGDVDAVVYDPDRNAYYLFKGNEYVRHKPGEGPTAGYPAAISGGSWSGWPASWGAGDVDAVVYNWFYEKYYLFKGDEYVRHTWGQPPDEGYPKPLAGAWPADWGPMTSVEITGSDRVERGGRLQLEATVHTTAQNGPRTVRWSSSDPTIARVSEDGLVRGVSGGDVIITATSDLDPSARGEHAVSVRVVTVEVSGPTEVPVDRSIQLTATVSDQDGPLPADVTWYSNGVHTRVNSTGLVTGLSEGSELIVARPTDFPAAEGTWSVQVTGGRFDAVVFYPREGVFYSFSGDTYSENAPGEFPENSVPLRTGFSWPGSWGAGSVDGVVYDPDQDYFYLFKGDEYVRHREGEAPDPDYPRKIADHWSGWPASWGPGDVDGVVYVPNNDKYYLFKGDEYARHSWDAPIDDGYPREIVGRWPGWDRDIDAVAYHDESNSWLFFEGGEYTRRTRGVEPARALPRFPVDDHFYRSEAFLPMAKNVEADLDWYEDNPDGQAHLWFDIPSRPFPLVTEHVQGVDRVGDQWVMSHSHQDGGYLIWGEGSEWDWNAAVFDSDHPGGIQAAGDVVAATVQGDKTVFHEFDGSEWAELRDLEIAQSGTAVGLAYYPPEDRYYAIVSKTHDTPAEDEDIHTLYVSEQGSSLTGPNRFRKVGGVGTIEAWGSQGGMTLVYDETTGSMWLLALVGELFAGFQENWIEASKLDLGGRRVVEHRRVDLEDTEWLPLLFAGPGFRFGAGLFIEDGHISLIATQRNISNPFDVIIWSR